MFKLKFGLWRNKKRYSIILFIIILKYLIAITKSYELNN